MRVLGQVPDTHRIDALLDLELTVGRLDERSRQ
jgi:hypothetical protein